MPNGAMRKLVIGIAIMFPKMLVRLNLLNVDIEIGNVASEATKVVADDVSRYKLILLKKFDVDINFDNFF